MWLIENILMIIATLNLVLTILSQVISDDQDTVFCPHIKFHKNFASAMLFGLKMGMSSHLAPRNLNDYVGLPFLDKFLTKKTFLQAAACQKFPANSIFFHFGNIYFIDIIICIQFLEVVISL